MSRNGFAERITEIEELALIYLRRIGELGAHPPDIRAGLEFATQPRRLSPGAVNGALTRLVKRGLAAVDRTGLNGGPGQPKWVYTITPEGGAELIEIRRWRQSLEDPDRSAYPGIPRGRVALSERV